MKRRIRHHASRSKHRQVCKRERKESGTGEERECQTTKEGRGVKEEFARSDWDDSNNDKARLLFVFFASFFSEIIEESVSSLLMICQAVRLESQEQ